MSSVSSVSQPLVSVYMTVKNGCPFIKEAVESIRRQTYENWEAVIVDDGSEDDTAAYLMGLEKKDHRFDAFLQAG